jgi:hypothetical protein
MSFTLWTALSNFYSNSNGPITGKHWDQTIGGGSAVGSAWVDSESAAGSYVADGTNTYTYVLTAQDPFGDQQDDTLSLATVTAQLPFSTADSPFPFAVGGIFFGPKNETTTPIYGGAIWWQPNAENPAEWDAEFEGATLTPADIITSTPALTLSGTTTALETGIANLTAWDTDNVGQNFVLGFQTTAPGASTEDVYFQGFNSSGTAISPLVHVGVALPVGTPWKVGSTEGTAFYFVDAPGTSVDFTSFDAATGAVGTTIAFSTSFTTILSIRSNYFLSTGDTMIFVEGTTGSTESLQETFLNASFVPVGSPVTISLSDSGVEDMETAELPNNGEVLAYTDANTVHLVEFNDTGGLIQNFTVPGITSFDQLTSLGDGRVELSYRTTVAGNENVEQGFIFDTRTAGATLSEVSSTGFLAGTPFDDSVTGSTTSSEIDGGAGWNGIVYNFASSQATITQDANGFWTIVKPSGTDTVTNIEAVQFTDKTISLRTAAAADFNNSNTSDVLWRDDSTGDTGFYQIGNGVSSGWTDIGASSTAYTVVGVGDFVGYGASDVLFRSSATGDTGFYDIVDGAFQDWQDIGASSTAYAVVGVGDFYANGTDDVLYRDNSTGDTGFYKIVNGAYTGWVDVGPSSTAYSVVGVGDFMGNGTDDILYRDNTTGDTGFYNIVNGANTGWVDVGPSSTAYSVVGVGDFMGNGTDDILYRDNTTGDTGFYDIINGVNTGWHDIGASSTAYSVVAVGDYLGNGTDAVLLRDNTTGDTGFYAISNGVNAGWHDIGSSSTAYHVVS